MILGGVLEPLPFSGQTAAFLPREVSRRLIAIQSTARGMFLGLRSRKDMNYEDLVTEMLLRKLAALV